MLKIEVLDPSQIDKAAATVLPKAVYKTFSPRAKELCRFIVTS